MAYGTPQQTVIDVLRQKSRTALVLALTLLSEGAPKQETHDMILKAPYDA